jgi:hypothetical protein
MRDFHDAKAMTQTLRDTLQAKAVTVSHSESLELVSKMLGLNDWNTLSALLKRSATLARCRCYCQFLPVSVAGKQLLLETLDAVAGLEKVSAALKKASTTPDWFQLDNFSAMVNSWVK